MEHRSTGTTPAFRRFAEAVLLLRNRGLSEKAIDAFIRRKILGDLAHARAKRLQPSLN